MKLISIEWMKLRRLNTMKVILLIYAVVVPIIYFLYSLVEIPIQTPAGVITFSLPSTLYEFPQCYQVVAWTSSLFNLMLGVIIIVFTANELKYRTQRQNMIDGLSKRDIILSKFYVVVILAAIVTIYTFLVGFITGLIFSNDVSEMLNGLEQTGVYFISTIGYFIFAFFFANLVRMPALAIILYLLSTILEGILGFIAVRDFVQFFPLNTFSKLVPFPDIFPQEMTEDAPNLMWEQGQRVLLALSYISIFVIVSYQVIKRRDL